MRRLLVLATLLGCASGTRPAVTTPPSNRSPAVQRASVDLPVSFCVDPTEEDCGDDRLRGSTVVAHEDLAGCTAASRVELRNFSTRGSDRLCGLVLHDAEGMSIVETGLHCKLYGAEQRVVLTAARCEGDRIDVDLAVAGVATPITCRGGTGWSCERAPSARPTEPTLAAFLDHVAYATEQHRWNDLLSLCAPWHRDTQLVQLGMNEPAYLADILGLHVVHNSIGGEDGRVTLDDLDGIEKLELAETVAGAGRSHVATGWIHLRGGARLRITLAITQLDDGRYALAGATG